MLRLARHWWRTGKKKITAARTRRLPPGLRLHVGCGPVHLPGWINIDNRPYEAADYVWDVRDDLPFRELSFVFAEHFIEHLPIWEAHRFLVACRSALGETGVLRLSTPNLDWVYQTQYGPNASQNAIENCFNLNASFRGWGHHFLYDRETLERVLRSAGFSAIRFTTYGVSEFAELRDLERHERAPDEPSLPHVLVVEASGRTTVEPLETLPGAPAFLSSLGAS